MRFERSATFHFNRIEVLGGAFISCKFEIIESYLFGNICVEKRLQMFKLNRKKMSFVF